MEKAVVFSLEFTKNEPLRHLRWLVSETSMHQLPETMFLISFRQDHFSNHKIRYLGSTLPFLYLKNCSIFTQTQQKWHYQTSAVARFRGTYVPTSTKHASAKPKTRSFQLLNNNFFRFNSLVFIFKELWYFYSNSAKATLSDTWGGSLQRQVCTDFQKICFYWA